MPVVLVGVFTLRDRVMQRGVFSSALDYEPCNRCGSHHKRGVQHVCKCWAAGVGSLLRDSGDSASPASPHEHNIGLAHVLPGVSAEEQVAPTGSLHNLQQAGLVDGQVVAVPCLDALLVAANMKVKRCGSEGRAQLT